jgi:hypothetical protein
MEKKKRRPYNITPSPFSTRKKSYLPLKNLQNYDMDLGSFDEKGEQSPPKVSEKNTSNLRS